MKQVIEAKTRRSVLRGQNSGQAVVEYILMIAIAVGISFALRGVFNNMKGFVENYLGKYTACLMEYGELPVLGVTNDDLKEHLSSSNKCETGFKAFTFGEGRPPIAGSSPNASATNKGQKKQGDSEKSTTSSTASSSKKSDKDKRDSVGGGSGSSSPYTEGSLRRSGGRSTADGVAGGRNNVRLIEEDESEGSGRQRRPRQSRIIYRNNGERYRAITGKEADLLDKSSRSTLKRKPTSRSIAKADDGGRAGPRTGLIQPPEKKIIIAEDTSDSGWGFGKMLKWLLIIAIIVAIVIFFGGQLLNYSNSDS